MGKEGSTRSTDDCPSRKIGQRLRTLSPTEAAFVLHLAQCQRCRDLAQRILSGEEQLSQKPVLVEGLSTEERDLFLSLVKAAYLTSLVLADPSPQTDLPPNELRGFLRSLPDDQATIVRHLLRCESCQVAAARLLSPTDDLSFEEEASSSQIQSSS